MNHTSFLSNKKRTVCTLFLCCCPLLFARTAFSAKIPDLYSSLFGDSDCTIENNCEDADYPADTSESNSAAGKTADTVSYALRYKHNRYHGAHITGAVSGGGYAGFLQLQSPYPMPYFELSVKNFGMGVYPLFALQQKYPEKNIPSLFAGTGSLMFGNLLSLLQKPAITSIKPDAPVFSFPHNDFVRVGQSNHGMHYAVSLTGREWSGAFIASPEKKQKRMQYGLYTGWQKKYADYQGLQLGVQQFTGFTPLIPEKNTAPVSAKMQYHSIAALRFLLKHPNIACDTTGICTVSAEKQLSGSFTAHLHGFYRYAGVHYDCNYVHSNHIAWKGKHEPQHLFTAFRPYVKAGIFSLYGLYSYQNTIHGYGITAHIKHSIVRWKGEWIARKQIHTLNTAITITGQPEWFSTVRYFDKAGVKTTVRLQEQAVNPLIIKDYTLSAYTVFGIVDGLSCGISGSWMQKTSSKKLKKSKTAVEVFSYTAPEYGGKTFLKLQKEGIGRTHSGTIEFSAKSVPPYFDFSISYTLRK
ncbi:MAG: hypothetical protein ACTTH8_03515 [Treponema sp.]